MSYKSDEEGGGLTEQEIADLLSSGDEARDRVLQQDIHDIEASNPEMGIESFSEEDWHDLMSFNEFLEQPEIQKLIKESGEKSHSNALDLYNGFNLMGARYTSDIEVNEGVDEYFNVVTNFYSHGKSFNDITTVFIVSMQPLFDLLKSSFSDDTMCLVKISRMEDKWQKKFAEAFTKIVVLNRIAKNS